MGSPSPTPTSGKHYALLGKEPTEAQVRLYENFPEYRGISDRSLDPEVMEAIVVQALVTGTVKDRVFIYAPPAHEAWVMQQFDSIASVIFEIVKTTPFPKKYAMAYGMMFQKIAFMGRVLQVPSEPAHWLSFGFVKSDPVPDWLKDRLLE